MLTYQQAQQIFQSAELIRSEQVVMQTLQRLAADITAELSQRQPLVLCLMGGAVVFTGQLLPCLKFPLDFDYVHLTRYGNTLQGGRSGGSRREKHEGPGRVGCGRYSG